MPLIVIVEDEWSIRAEVADTMSQAGWNVEEFASGEQALAFLLQNRKIAGLITDIRLSGQVSGWDVAQAYRAADSAIKVVYCSANAPDLYRQVPHSRFMAKPCQMMQILGATGLPGNN